MEESLVNVEFLKSSNNFIARIQSELGGMREYRSSSFEEVLEQVVIDYSLRRRGVDHLARVDELRRPAGADDPRQSLATAEPRDDSDVNLGLTELRAVRGDPDVAGEGEFAAATQGVSVDRRDDRLVATGHRVAEPPAHLGEGAHLQRGQPDHLLDIRAGDERLVPRPGQDDRADGLGHREVLDRHG